MDDKFSIYNIVNAAKKLGLPLSHQGICYGFSIMLSFAINSDEEEFFFKRLTRINKIMRLPDSEQEVELKKDQDILTWLTALAVIQNGALYSRTLGLPITRNYEAEAKLFAPVKSNITVSPLSASLTAQIQSQERMSGILQECVSKIQERCPGLYNRGITFVIIASRHATTARFNPATQQFEFYDQNESSSLAPYGKLLTHQSYAKKLFSAHSFGLEYLATMFLSALGRDTNKPFMVQVVGLDSAEQEAVAEIFTKISRQQPSMTAKQLSGSTHMALGAMSQAISDGDFVKLKHVVDNSANISPNVICSVFVDEGENLLTFAIKRRANIQMIRYLREKIFNPSINIEEQGNWLNMNRQNPLHVALVHDNMDALVHLLADDMGREAKFLAMDIENDYEGHYPFRTDMQELAYMQRTQDADGMTPLHLAVLRGNISAIKLLCEAINKEPEAPGLENVKQIKDNKRRTPIDIAIELGLGDDIKSLLKPDRQLSSKSHGS